MKWLIPGIWLAAILFAHFRGRVKLPLSRQLLDHSVLLAPVNAFMVLASRVPTTPYLPSREIDELKVLDDNWETIRDEALQMAEMRRIRAADGHNDIGFSSFFKYGWKRFYLKWYDADHPSASALCPVTTELLKGIPNIKAAMFASLPPGSRLPRHRDPYAGSLRFHMGLITPNSPDCYINVDGETYYWRDGEAVVFDETFIHYAENKTDQNRIILFADVERPMRFRWAQAVNRVVGGFLLRAAAAPNQEGDKTGGINRIFGAVYAVRRVGKALKKRSQPLYYLTKWLLVGGILAWIFL